MTGAERQFPRSNRSAAFTLVELLLAMGVLMFGMIGLAAAIYTGMGQTRSTVDESVAAAVARQAFATMTQVMRQANTPETDLAYRPVYNPDAPEDRENLQTALSGMQISADPRYAWIPLYRREINSLVAHVIIVVVRAESRDRFDPADLRAFDPDDGTYPPALVPADALVQIEANTVTINSPAGAGRLAPGALLVLRGMSESELNGRIVRLGEQLSDDQWSLLPGQDLADAAGPSVGDAYIVGRHYADPTRPRQGYAGASQVVAAYATMVPLQ